MVLFGMLSERHCTPSVTRRLVLGAFPDFSMVRTAMVKCNQTIMTYDVQWEEDEYERWT